MNRNSGLDLFRILCCVGVLGYHILDDVVFSGNQSAILPYFLVSFCVPGFFLLQGFLLARHTTLSMEYCEQKIVHTIAKLTGWCIFWVVVHFIHTGELLSFWDQLRGSFLSDGMLPVGWFLFPYCLFVLLGYPLYHLQKRTPLAFELATFGWLILLAAVPDLQGRQLGGQALWIPLYLGYFVAGMALSHIMETVSVRTADKRASRVLQGVLSAAICAASLAIYLHKAIFAAEGFQFPDHFYGSWYYTCWLISLFWLTSLLSVRHASIQLLLKRAAGNTFTVYLGHLPILIYLTGLSPLLHTHTALLYILLFFVGLQLLAEGFRRLPLLRKLV